MGERDDLEVQVGTERVQERGPGEGVGVEEVVDQLWWEG